MKLWGLFKANLRSIKTQQELETAMAMGDQEKTKQLIVESMSSILKSGLTKKQLNTLEQIKIGWPEETNKLLADAFQRGWIRSGTPNLSNAMDEVLRQAQELISEHRKAGL